MSGLQSETAKRKYFRVYLISSFVADLVVPVLYIYLPLFAYEIGASPSQIGLVGGANYLVFAFMPFFMGHFSDRAGSRRTFVTAALSITCSISFLYSLVGVTPLTLIFLRVVEGVGWSMLWPAIESGISESAPMEARQAIGVYNFIWSGASALAPLLGAFLVFAFSIRFTFLITALVLLAAIAINVVSIVKERKVNTSHLGSEIQQQFTHPQKDEEDNEDLQGKRNLKTRRTTANSKSALTENFLPILSENAVYILCTVMGAMAVATFLTFFPSYAESVGIPVLLLGGIVFSYGLTRFTSFFLASRYRLRNRMLSPSNRNRVVLSALAMISLSGFLFVLAPHGNVLAYILAFVLAGSAYPIIISVTQVVLVVEAPSNQAGRGAGISESSIGMGSFLGPVLGGLLFGRSLRLPFILPSVVILLALPFFLLFTSTKNKSLNAHFHRGIRKRHS